jgi:hypothetical protein
MSFRKYCTNLWKSGAVNGPRDAKCNGNSLMFVCHIDTCAPNEAIERGEKEAASVLTHVSLQAVTCAPRTVPCDRPAPVSVAQSRAESHFVHGRCFVLFCDLCIKRTHNGDVCFLARTFHCAERLTDISEILF